jgi:hypothetical protein
VTSPVAEPATGRRSRRTLALAVLGLVVVLLAVGAVVVVERTDRTYARSWDRLPAEDDSTVLLRYSGSSCPEGVRVAVDEDDDEVVLTVYQTVRRGSCDASAPTYEVEVRLDRPLGERELVDGAAGSSWWSGLLDR